MSPEQQEEQGQRAGLDKPQQPTSQGRAVKCTQDCRKSGQGREGRQGASDPTEIRAYAIPLFQVDRNSHIKKQGYFCSVFFFNF